MPCHLAHYYDYDYEQREHLAVSQGEEEGGTLEAAPGLAASGDDALVDLLGLGSESRQSNFGGSGTGGPHSSGTSPRRRRRRRRHGGDGSYWARWQEGEQDYFSVGSGLRSKEGELRGGGEKKRMSESGGGSGLPKSLRAKREDDGGGEEEGGGDDIYDGYLFEDYEDNCTMVVRNVSLVPLRLRNSKVYKVVSLKRNLSCSLVQASLSESLSPPPSSAVKRREVVKAC